MKLLIVLALVAVALARPALNVDMIEKVNSANAAWRAGVNQHWVGWEMEQVRGLMGALEGGILLEEKKFTAEELAAAPESYDTRDQWKKQCPSTDEVRDQSNCGSCWAFGAVEAMTDRTCIASNGAIAPHLSASDMLSCCGFSCGMGCNGGYPGSAWSYWKSTGLVSGGNYGDKSMCYSYPLEECDHHVNGTKKPCPATVPTPPCTKKCENGADWQKDKHFGASTYSVTGEANMMAEISTKGPIEGAFSVYEDFLSYKNGVYHHVSGSMLGGHAIKVLGYGTENGVKYWTVANSWNTDWGNKGYFKIRRGNNECGIEGQGVAGAPKL